MNYLCVCVICLFFLNKVFPSFFVIILILNILQIHAVGKRSGWSEVLLKYKLDKVRVFPLSVIVASGITGKVEDENIV